MVERHVDPPVRVYAVMHSLRALECLAFAPMSTAELVHAIGGVDQRTIRRYLKRLNADGYVEQEATRPRRRYRLTHRLAAMGRQAIAHDPLPRTAAPRLAALAAQTGQVATLWIPCYEHVVCILHTRPGQPPPQPILGALEPAHATAPGKALLAHRAAWRESLLDRPLQRYTPRTLTDPRDLAAELNRIRDTGHATDHGEHHEDVHAIAAPVFHHDEAIAAIAIALHAGDHASTDHDTLTVHLTRAARDLATTLNHQP
jgi:DNA-binding IclR family transcriptional regulator